MKRSHRAWIVPVVASLLVCSLLAPALVATPVAAQDEDSGGAGLAIATQEFDADRTTFEVTVYEDGSATWTLRYMQALDTEEDRQDFEAYGEDFENNETELYTAFRSGAEQLTANGSEATGREMSAENFQRDARAEGLDPSQATRGVVEMSFRWEGFARVEESVVMDVFEGGLYIASDQQLVVRTGPNLGFADVQPDDGEFDDGTVAESDTVTWSGDRSFDPGRPRVEFVDSQTATATSTPAAGGVGWLLPVGALVVVLLLGLGAAVAYRTDAFPAIGGVGRDSNAGDGGSGVASGGADAGAEAAAGAGTGVSDEDLISDEEQVVTLLEENGGRMKQVRIVDETGWSKSKVSMLLSDMEDESTISKLRVGRENIVSLAGHEPDAAGSPFDEDDEE